MAKIIEALNGEVTGEEVVIKLFGRLTEPQCSAIMLRFGLADSEPMEIENAASLLKRTVHSVGYHLDHGSEKLVDILRICVRESADNEVTGVQAENLLHYGFVSKQWVEDRTMVDDKRRREAHAAYAAAILADPLCERLRQSEIGGAAFNALAAQGIRTLRDLQNTPEGKVLMICPAESGEKAVDYLHARLSELSEVIQSY